jgi:aryl-alcohol dehydrogenase-like predicted oxidoreductase
MKTRSLGPDGPEVSAISLGGMYLSIIAGGGRPDEAQGIATIHAALDAGMTLIDTANVYCKDDPDLGHNERLIAKAIRGRKGVLVATKGGLRRPNGAWVRDGHPDSLTKACDESLRALGVEQIDLYQLHAVDDRFPFPDMIGALVRLREAGKIARIGLSNVSAAQIEEARAITEITSVQNRWSSAHRKPERDDVLATCERHGIAFLAYSPFGGASGAKTLMGTPLGAEAARRGMSPHRMILAWMLAKSPVAIPIPGARRAESTRDSAAAAEVVLTTEDLAAIERSFGV